MKGILCICAGMLLLMDVAAQYPLSDSLYMQRFDSLSAGLPGGWFTEVNAKANKPGVTAKYTAVPGTTTRWSNASGGFKNVASANGFATYGSASPALQQAATDRALGIRQTSSFGDPGAAFVFRIDHTYELHDFKISFQLQSLDTAAGRKTSWLLQYGLGVTPDTFITVASGTTGSTYTSYPIAASFGTALDHSAEPVFIRIVSLAAARGTGGRGVAAIDNVQLRWKAVARDASAPVPVAFYPAPGASHVQHGSVLSVRFNREIKAGSSGNFLVTDETDHSRQLFPSTGAVAGGVTIRLGGVMLHPGHTYHITYDSLIADTAGFYVPALKDTALWRFTVDPFVPELLQQDFDTSCNNGHILPAGWSRYSISGAAEWHCDAYSPANAGLGIYGHDSSGYKENDDWLISPLVRLSSPDITGIGFSKWDSGTGAAPEVLLSSDYAGSGSPDPVSWKLLSLSAGSGSSGWKSYLADIPAADRAEPIHLAFRYHSDSLSGLSVLLDSIRTLTRTGFREQTAAAYDLRVAGIPKPERIDIILTIPSDGRYILRLHSVTGQLICERQYYLQAGHQWLSLDQVPADPGLHILTVQGNDVAERIKCILR